MRLVTLNTWKNSEPYDARLSAMTALLADARAELILLQEAFIGGGLDTAGYLGGALDMHVHAAPARPKPRMQDGAMVDSTNGLAILSSRAAEETAIVTLPSAEADPDRIAQVARFGGLTVVNLHLTHLFGADALRRDQVQHLLGVLTAGNATVVGGDLNAEPGAPALIALGDAGFRDLAGPEPFDTCGRRRIDYLLCRDLPVAAVHVAPVGADPVGGVHASDHVGVLAALTLGGG